MGWAKCVAMLEAFGLLMEYAESTFMTRGSVLIVCGPDGEARESIYATGKPIHPMGKAIQPNLKPSCAAGKPVRMVGKAKQAGLKSNCTIL
jgi:hypothetical protein